MVSFCAISAMCPRCPYACGSHQLKARDLRPLPAPTLFASQPCARTRATDMVRMDESSTNHMSACSHRVLHVRELFPHARRREDACYVNQSPISHTLYSLRVLSCTPHAHVPSVRAPEHVRGCRSSGQARVCVASRRVRELDRVSHRSSTAACSEPDGAPDFAKAHGRRRKPQARCG